VESRGDASIRDASSLSEGVFRLKSKMVCAADWVTNRRTKSRNMIKMRLIQNYLQREKRVESAQLLQRPQRKVKSYGITFKKLGFKVLHLRNGMVEEKLAEIHMSVAPSRLSCEVHQCPAEESHA
jgi:SPX domain protein involved in polyphosphate accumulation